MNRIALIWWLGLHFWLLFFPIKLFSSSIGYPGTPESDSSLHPPKAYNLLQAFEHGQFHGNFRSFFMATDNAPGLSDYFALAAGGGLHFNSAPWHGFSFGIGGIFNFNITSSDFSLTDPATGASNRYELGLFDIENPRNKHDLDRIEELWLRYQWKKSRITLGQQSVQTPFLNNQDGRMRPTAELGVWAELNDIGLLQLSGGWLWRISPRSTVRWYPIGESIGLYPKGLNPDGTASGYPENIKSEGIGLIGLKWPVNRFAAINIWNTYVDNVVNTALIQTDISFPLKNSDKILANAQFTHQNCIGNGGNADPLKTYCREESTSNVLSFQAGWNRKNWTTLLAYTRITSDGRFLFPREWGREPFFTYMQRERIEGSGNTDAITARINWTSEEHHLVCEAVYGHFYLPDILDYAYNKYSLTAYRQLNLDVRYSFTGVLEGLKLQILYVWKGRIGNVYEKDKYIINKVNLSHYNIIANYNF